MKRRLQVAVLMVGGLLTSTLRASAIDTNLCTSIGLNEPQARQLYFQRTNDRGVLDWVPFTSFAATGMSPPAEIRFAYVVREQSHYNLKNELERSGVLVLKSGIYIPLATQTNPDAVRLVRKGVGADFGCRARPASDFGRRQTAPISRARPALAWQQTVSAISYDLYHDKANEDANEFRTEVGKRDLAKIKRFHVAYGEDRYPNCISTDSVAVPFSGMPNNRSQFSYQATTVRNGITRETVRWNLFTPAIADPAQTLRRTEMLPYRTVQGTACVTFSLKYSALTQFLYVNDLEGRQSRGVREPEQRYN